MKFYVKSWPVHAFFQEGDALGPCCLKEVPPRVINPDSNILAQRNLNPPKVGATPQSVLRGLL